MCICLIPVHVNNFVIQKTLRHSYDFNIYLWLRHGSEKQEVLFHHWVLCNLVIFCNLGSEFKTKTKKDKEKVRSKFRTNESHGRLKPTITKKFYQVDLKPADTLIKQILV